jgi:hypothetical protein
VLKALWLTTASSRPEQFEFLQERPLGDNGYEHTAKTMEFVENVQGNTLLGTVGFVFPAHDQRDLDEPEGRSGPSISSSGTSSAQRKPGATAQRIHRRP